MKQISWLKDWYIKQEQLDRLVETYKNYEMKPVQNKKSSKGK